MRLSTVSKEHQPMRCPAAPEEWRKEWTLLPAAPVDPPPPGPWSAATAVRQRAHSCHTNSSAVRQRLHTAVRQRRHTVVRQRLHTAVKDCRQDENLSLWEWLCTSVVSPWCNHPGWLGKKNKLLINVLTCWADILGTEWVWLGTSPVYFMITCQLLWVWRGTQVVCSII